MRTLKIVEFLGFFIKESIHNHNLIQVFNNFLQRIQLQKVKVQVIIDLKLHHQIIMIKILLLVSVFNLY